MAKFLSFFIISVAATEPRFLEGGQDDADSKKGRQLLLPLFQMDPKGKMTTIAKETRDPWRSDGKCGPQNPLPDGTPAQCNPVGDKPCCSGSWCGETKDHCLGPKSTDYRCKQEGQECDWIKGEKKFCDKDKRCKAWGDNTCAAASTEGELEKCTEGGKNKYCDKATKECTIIAQSFQNDCCRNCKCSDDGINVKSCIYKYGYTKNGKWNSSTGRHKQDINYCR